MRCVDNVEHTKIRRSILLCNLDHRVTYSTRFLSVTDRDSIYLMLVRDLAEPMFMHASCSKPLTTFCAVFVDVNNTRPAKYTQTYEKEMLQGILRIGPWSKVPQHSSLVHEAKFF